jgi:small subunit ribosomal protein S17
MTTNQPQPRTLQGLVTSDKMTKTVVVSVTRMQKHPKYKKFMKVTAKFKAHNPDNTYHTGDKVIIQETRPMSKEKRWIVTGKIS